MGEYIDMDMSGAVFREVDLTGARMRGVLLGGADIDGDIRGLRVNGVEVAPLVEAELDRLHPERTKLRATTPEEMREAWATVGEFWAATMAGARALDEEDLHRSVDGEWSFTETLRHLICVTDMWFGHAVRGEPRPFHPFGLPASFIRNGAEFGIDEGARPSFEEVAEVRAGRFAQVEAYLAAATQADLDLVLEPNPAPGWPPPARRTPTACLHVIFNEEWTHHQFAIRDLSTLSG